MTADDQAQADTVDDAPDGAASAGSAGEAHPDTAADGGTPGSRRLVRSLIALTVITVAAVGFMVGYFFLQYRPDRQTNDAASKAVLEAAYDGTLALLSYTPDNFDAEMATAKAHLTGDFLTYYGRFTDEVMGPAVKQRGVQANARVVRGAVSELHPNSAVVLLFVDQTNASRERPDPGFAASAVRVTLTKVKDSWLISKFEPV